ncbi:MAG: helix-turn-helix domain-containing protein [Planctomycetota bacterium]|nr:helix-turn-helix domain-containing protein [Planctomycetota bacterium]
MQDHVAQLEKEVLKKALVKTGGNKAETARMLKIDYKTIHTKLKKYGITMDDARENESD